MPMMPAEMTTGGAKQAPLMFNSHICMPYCGSKVGCKAEPSTHFFKTDREQQIISSAPHGTPNRRQRDLMKRFVQDLLMLEAEAEKKFTAFFVKMGAHLASTALDVMEGRKSKFEDELLA